MATSLITDMASGAWGWVKGMLTGGTLGAATGALVGVAIACFTGSFLIWPAMGAAAALGAEIGALALGSIGAVAGATTHIARNHDVGKVPVEEAITATKVAFNKGREVEKALHQQQGVETKWREKYAKEQAAKAIDTGQRLHS